MGHSVIGTGHTLGGGSAGRRDSTPLRANNREAVLAAAEKRKQDVGFSPLGLGQTADVWQEQRRGTSGLNPNAGKLSSQLAAKNRNKSPEPKQPERLVVSTRLLSLAAG